MSDTIYSKPGATFYSELDNAASGLVGTVGVRILRKSDNAVIAARTTEGIVESPEGSGRYVFTGTAPTTQDKYSVLWDTNAEGALTTSNWAEDDLVVTYSSLALGEGSGILTLAEYKALRAVSDEDRDSALQLALEAADAAILRYTGRDFTTTPASATKEYAWNDSGYIQIADATEITAVKLDEYELPTENWRAGPLDTAYTYTYVELLWRRTSPAMGFEKNLDRLLRGSYSHFNTAYVTASFGWPQDEIPADVKLAAAVIVDQLAPATDGDESGLAAHSIETFSEVYNTPAAPGQTAPLLPPEALALLDQYRRVRF